MIRLLPTWAAFCGLALLAGCAPSGPEAAKSPAAPNPSSDAAAPPEAAPAAPNEVAGEPAPSALVEQARLIAQKYLGDRAPQVDPDKPLREQGADELDVIEIAMLYDEEFHVEIPDQAFGAGDQQSPTLTVRQLANVIHQLQQKSH